MAALAARQTWLHVASAGLARPGSKLTAKSTGRHGISAQFARASSSTMSGINNFISHCLARKASATMSRRSDCDVNSSNHFARSASTMTSGRIGDDGKNRPLSGNEMQRSGGIASMMRLPVQNNTDGLDACFVGIPLDCGASNRSGTRLGPRQIRQESCLIRASNYTLGATPFEDIQVGDIGDVSVNIYDLPEAARQIRNAYDVIVRNGCVPLTLGGDHVITFPILQAIKDKHGPVGLIHVDAHADISDQMLGAKVAHGTPFRRAVESGCLDTKRVVQIGLRGSLYSLDDYQWAFDQGFRVVPASECHHKSLVPLMAEVRAMMGDGPVYISFDIDALDPSFAPGTGTPEIGGLTSIQALEVIHGAAGLNIVGGDMVEVSPPYDMGGTTALTAANLLFEMLCVLPGVQRRKA